MGAALSDIEQYPPRACLLCPREMEGARVPVPDANKRAHPYCPVVHTMLGTQLCSFMVNGILQASTRPNEAGLDSWSTVAGQFDVEVWGEEEW